MQTDDPDFEALSNREALSENWLEPIEDTPYVFDHVGERLDDWQPIFVLELEADPSNGMHRGVRVELFPHCGRLLHEQGKDEDIAASVFLGSRADLPDMADREGQKSVLIAVRESVESGEGMVERIVPLVRLTPADHPSVGALQQADLVARLLVVPTGRPSRVARMLAVATVTGRCSDGL